MIIDIAFFIFLIFGVFQGYSKGLVLGIFSLLSFIIGLAAALKLSAVVAEHLHKDFGGLNKWMPVFAFILVFVLFMVLVSFIGKFIRKALQLAMLGWLDSFLGIILYLVLYTIIFSILLFFAEKMLLIPADVISTSYCYPYVVTWGPRLINNLGRIIPIFKDMFVQLESFFSTIASKGG